jgi:hypothetical protein
LLAVGGIQWTSVANSLYSSDPKVIVEDDFSLTVLPGNKITNMDWIFFPAIMGLIGGIVFIIFAACFDGLESFPGTICNAIATMLIPIGILNFLAGITRIYGIEHTKEVQYPSPVLHYLFVYHRKTSIFIFAAASAVFFIIGSKLIEGPPSAGKAKK